MLHLTYPDIARLITLAEQDYCLPHLPSDLNSSGWAIILLYTNTSVHSNTICCFCCVFVLFCDFVCFFFSDLFFALVFGSFFLHNFSLVRWCYWAPLKHSEVPSIFTVFLPRHSFSAIMEGKFF